MFRLKTATAAATALALSLGIAAAEPALTSADLNMRAGPGVNNPVISVIPRGAEVEVMSCTGNWCAVDYGGITGYASANFLTMDTGMTGAIGSEYMDEPEFFGAAPDDDEDYFDSW